jgi:hypothetical protein
MAAYCFVFQLCIGRALHPMGDLPIYGTTEWSINIHSFIHMLSLWHIIGKKRKSQKCILFFVQQENMTQICQKLWKCTYIYKTTCNIWAQTQKLDCVFLSATKCNY